MNESVGAELDSSVWLSALLALSQDAILCVNPDGQVMQWSAGAEVMFGLHAAQMLGQNVTRFVPQERRREFESLRESLLSGQPVTFETVRVREDGARFDVHIRATPVRDRAGEVSGAVITLRDITQRLRTERALAHSEARFRNAFEHAAVGMALVSLDGSFLHVNAALCEMLGYSLSELTARNFQSISHPDDVEGGVSFVLDCKLGRRESYQADKRYIHRDGHIVPIQLSSRVERDERGEALYFVSQMQNLSTRIAAQQRLAEENVRLVAVIQLQNDITSAGADLARIDRLVLEKTQALTGGDGASMLVLEGETLRVRQATGRFAERGEQSVARTRGMLELATQDRMTVVSDDVLNDDRVAIAGARALGIRSIVVAPIKHLHRVLGALTVVSEAVGVFHAHVRWALELVAGMIAVSMERSEEELGRRALMAEREAALEALARSQARFRNAFESSSMGMALVDEQRRWIEVNAALCDILGYSHEELVGIHLRPMIHPDDFLIEPEPGQKAQVRGEGFQREKRLRHRDGRWVWTEFNLSMLDESAEGRRDAIVQIQNISSRKQTEVQLQRSLREKEVLLKEIHHRVKNNLQVINSMLRLQANRAQSPEAAAVLRSTQDRVYAIALLHERLYRSDDMGRVHTGDYVRDLVQGIIRANDLNVAADLIVDVGNIRLELTVAVPFGLCLNELITNALKHGFPVPRPWRNTISVTLQRRADQLLELSVVDNGVGIPEDMDLAQSRSVGLHVVKTLARQLRGELTVSGGAGTRAVLVFNDAEED